MFIALLSKSPSTTVRMKNHAARSTSLQSSVEQFSNRLLVTYSLLFDMSNGRLRSAKT